jgi:drug/metabolite transporter (DMT)-like permease
LPNLADVGEALAVVASVLFALGTVLQQKGTMSTEAGEDDPRFLVQILHRPVWLTGAALMAIGWVVQAMALDRASLVVVQALTALQLVIALPLGVVLTQQHIGKREASGAGLTLVGIIFFIAAGQPQGGTSHASASAWWTTCVLIFGLVGLLVLVGARFHGGAKAITLGAAAGLGFGLQAAVTKTFVTQIGGGVHSLLTSWSVYILILSALTGFALQQTALKTGVLAPAMASANSVTLFTSVILGVAVYGEEISKSGAGHSVSAYAGLLVAIAGVALLAGSESPQQAAPGAGTGAADPSPAT